MTAEWLSNAILESGENEAIRICFEYQSEPDRLTVKAERDSLLKFVFDNSHRYVLLNGFREDFLFYKDEANRFFMICGTAKFLSKACPYSKSTMKLIFMSWANDSFQTDEESQFLKNVWKKYRLS